MTNPVIFISLIIVIAVNVTMGHTSFQFPTISCGTSVVTQNYAKCAIDLAKSIWKIHRWGKSTNINICGNPCTGNLKGRISRLKWRWDAKFQCSEKGQGFQGKASAAGRSGAMKRAIEDWITKASSAGAINTNDFRC